MMRNAFIFFFSIRFNSPLCYCSEIKRFFFSFSLLKITFSKVFWSLIFATKGLCHSCFHIKLVEFLRIDPQNRSSQQRCAQYKKDVLTVLKNFAKFKKRLWQRCFPVNFAKLLRKPLNNTSGGCFCHVKK